METLQFSEQKLGPTATIKGRIMRNGLNVVLFVVCTTIICSCASTYSVNEYDGNIFEVICNTEMDSYSDRGGKIELLAAYVAESKGCDYFGSYSGISNPHRSGRSMGILSTRVSIGTMCKCVSNSGEHENVSSIKKTKEVIQIQESRYGSLRNMRKQ